MSGGRIAPEGGYDFTQKQRFRRFVWDAIADGVEDWTREVADGVLLMPSIEGIEIGEALRRGIPESHLHVVDHNPAIVATLRRRHPAITTYGVSVAKAHQRMGSRDVVLYGASLDLCSNATWGALLEVCRCSAETRWSLGARVVVNVLRGREDRFSTEIALTDERLSEVPWFRAAAKTFRPSGDGELLQSDLWRMWRIASAMVCHAAVPVRSTTYVSSNGQSFLTTAFSVWDIRLALRARAEGWLSHRMLRQSGEALISWSNRRNVLYHLSRVGAVEYGVEVGSVPKWLSALDDDHVAAIRSAVGGEGAA